jgi:gluconate 5-dehydrogenase
MHVKELFNLNGKIAVVTGGGRGIGRFMATGLAEAGANVVIASRKLENLEKEVQELEKLGVQALAVQCDMGKKEDIEQLVKAAMDKFGTIDILVNNAGLTWGAPTLDYPLEKWEKIFDVNVKGVWILSQQVARIMKEKGGGKMINVSSIYGSRGSNEEEHPAVAYNPSKFAVEGLTKTLALKLARYKIYVNCIAPGFFKTDMMAHLFKPEMKPILDLTVSAIPLKKYGEEDDVKGLAVFLASKASDYITGGVFPVDGGFSAQ